MKSLGVDPDKKLSERAHYTKSNLKPFIEEYDQARSEARSGTESRSKVNGMRGINSDSEKVINVGENGMVANRES